MVDIFFVFMKRAGCRLENFRLRQKNVSLTHKFIVTYDSWKGSTRSSDCCGQGNNVILSTLSLPLSIWNSKHKSKHNISLSCHVFPQRHPCPPLQHTGNTHFTHSHFSNTHTHSKHTRTHTLVHVNNSHRSLASDSCIIKNRKEPGDIVRFRCSETSPCHLCLRCVLFCSPARLCEWKPFKMG